LKKIDLIQPWHFLLVIFKKRLTDILFFKASAGEFLGFETSVNLTRSIHEKTADVMDTDPDLEVSFGITMLNFSM
jgi:hypothetical protein